VPPVLQALRAARAVRGAGAAYQGPLIDCPCSKQVLGCLLAALNLRLLIHTAVSTACTWKVEGGGAEPLVGA
jgi:hypothetical protein